MTPDIRLARGKQSPRLILGDCAKMREAITPKSDPDWKDICAKCNDGDIEPHYCEYYGEPNGCNSPIYGEHPTAENSSVVGDCAKMREALGKLRAALWNNTVIAGKRKFELYEIADAALAAFQRGEERSKVNDCH